MSYRTTRAFERKPSTSLDFNTAWLAFCMSYHGMANHKMARAFDAVWRRIFG